MSSHHPKRAVQGALAAIAMTALVTLVPTPATADPPVPDDAPAAVQQLADLSHQAELLTEQWH
ncbi:MAG: glycoside hydrolase, partial [Actinomycetes bacterium]